MAINSQMVILTITIALMPYLEIIITFSIIFLSPLFPNQTSATTCHETRCKPKEQWVRFPFQLTREGRDLSCGYERGFNLSCSTHDKLTLLDLSSSGKFIVNDIDFIDHVVWIDDPDRCFPKRLMEGSFSLKDSPFSYIYGVESYVFLSCPSESEILSPSLRIDCLSSHDYNVIAVKSSWFYVNASTNSSRPLAQTSLSRFCKVISTGLVPLSSSFDGLDVNYGVRLTWEVPDCSLCEASGRLCMLDSTKSLEQGIVSTVCYGPSNSVHQRKSGSETLTGAAYALGGGMIVLVLVCVFTMCCSSSNPSSNETISASSVVANHQPPPSAVTLNCVTTEAYPKARLGDESLELPNPNDKTCSICLCDYQPKETIKTIPQCGHYFHVACIDEWFRKNAACPLCRMQPNSEGLGSSIVFSL